MPWFIPTTHRLVIAVLLVVAAVAFILFWVTRAVAWRQKRRAESELRLAAQTAIRHGVRTPDARHETPVHGDPAPRPPAMPRDE